RPGRAGGTVPRGAGRTRDLRPRDGRERPGGGRQRTAQDPRASGAGRTAGQPGRGRPDGPPAAGRRERSPLTMPTFTLDQFRAMDPCWPDHIDLFERIFGQSVELGPENLLKAHAIGFKLSWLAANLPEARAVIVRDLIEGIGGFESSWLGPPDAAWAAVI